MPKPTIYISGDHAAFDLKKKIVAYLKKRGYRVRDFGPHRYDPDDDYPDFIIPMAKAVARDKNARGIALGGSGIGECIAANKVKGVRAAFANTTGIAYSSRHHNNANMLCLGGGQTKDPTTKGLGISFAVAKKILNVWLTTPFSNALRHIRRLKKIDKII